MWLLSPRKLKYLRGNNTTFKFDLKPTALMCKALFAAHARIHQIDQVKEISGKNALEVTWKDGLSAKFHKKWLRDHCRCSVCFNHVTKQREIDTFSIPSNPVMKKLQVQQKSFVISWKDDVRGNKCRQSEYDGEWLRKHAYSLTNGAKYPSNHRHQKFSSIKFWDSKLQLPTHTFESFMQDMKPGMQDLHDYGILRIAAMPSSMEDTERLARKIGFIMETIYGKMWTTNPQTDDQQYSDTASSNIELLHHTDGTYILDPPGLQIFNCIAQAGEGGDSCYIDSFYVVEKLRQTCPEAFDFFAKKTFHFHHYGKDVHYATMEPIIKLDHLGNIKHFRHNDYDRAPLTHMSYEDVEKFYTYHDKLLNIMRNGKMEFVSKMKVGEMVVVDNHRVMHARRAFLGNERALIGCYIGRNEYENRLRMLGII